MNKSDFRYLRRGKQLSDLKDTEFSLLKPINVHGKKNDRALLLLHGFSSSPAVYRYIIPLLKNYDALVCPALPGHAESIEAFAHASSEDWLKCAQDACAPLFKKYAKVDVIGLSLGGLLACKLSEQFAFNHMFLLAPALKLNMNTIAQLKLAKLLYTLGFRELRGAAGDMLTNEHAEISYKKVPIRSAIQVLKMVLEHRWIAPACPVDLFLGAHDKITSSPEVEKLFCALPNVSIHWLNQSAHVLPLDNDVDQIVTCINNA